MIRFNGTGRPEFWAQPPARASMLRDSGWRMVPGANIPVNDTNWQNMVLAGQRPTEHAAALRHLNAFSDAMAMKAPGGCPVSGMAYSATSTRSARTANASKSSCSIAGSRSSSRTGSTTRFSDLPRAVIVSA